LKAAGFQVERQLTVSHYRVGFLKRTVPLSWLVWMDSVAQLSGDWWQLSPSVFVRAQADQSTFAAQAGAFFACPACRFGLPEVKRDLECPSCGRGWKYQDGIYDFRID
jgi:hypothetical protein